MSQDKNQKKDPDAVTMQELTDIHAWGEDKDDEELIQAASLVFRNKTIPWMSSFMNKCLSDDPAIITDRTLRINLQACRRKLLELHATTIETIAEALDTAAGRLPNNLYNIKDALENIARRLDPFEPIQIKTACMMLQHDICPHYSGSGAIFARDDMDEEFQKGFEAGYDRCLKEGGEEVDGRFESIDLHE